MYVNILERFRSCTWNWFFTLFLGGRIFGGGGGWLIFGGKLGLVIRWAYIRGGLYFGGLYFGVLQYAIMTVLATWPDFRLSPKAVKYCFNYMILLPLTEGTDPGKNLTCYLLTCKTRQVYNGPRVVKFIAVIRKWFSVKNDLWKK